MSSSEIVDSGTFSGGRSNFSQTCSLLSQYLKEKGSFGELTLGLSQNSDSKGAPTETMNLLSMIESAHRSGSKPKAETAPMTIFYAGQVLVFKDFPADKAKEIMMLASATAAFQSPAESATTVPHHSPPPPLGSDLPIARKNSLARFLEKRRDRITANAPYPAKHTAAPPPKREGKTEAWLGLAPQLPL